MIRIKGDLTLKRALMGVSVELMGAGVFVAGLYLSSVGFSPVWIILSSIVGGLVLLFTGLAVFWSSPDIEAKRAITGIIWVIVGTFIFISGLFSLSFGFEWWFFYELIAGPILLILGVGNLVNWRWAVPE